MTDSQIYQQRLAKLQETLKKKNCQLLQIDNLTDLFYLTGLELSAGQLLVDITQAELIVDGRYIYACKQSSPFPVTLQENGLMEKRLNELANQGPFHLGFDSNCTTYAEYMRLSRVVNAVNKNNKKIELIALDSSLKQQRAVKDSTELAALRDAAILGSKGYDYVCTLLKEGISEEEAALELEIFWRRAGGEELAFKSIIAFGANSAMPHHRSGKTTLKKGDTILIDIGVKLNHYNSDMTRVLFMGQPDPKMKEIYGIVKEAQQAALDLCKPGVVVADLDRAARALITSRGYGEAFSHGLGHGVGLEIHEFPIIKQIPSAEATHLEEGMVITIEPGIYIGGLGGVRIENTVAITRDGFEDLTKRSREITVI